MELRYGARMLALAALLPFAQGALAQTAILGSTTAGAAYVFPNVTFTGSCPATTVTTPVTGISGTPHGVGYYGSDFALISNFSNSQVWNVQISTHAVLNTISTGSAGYNGTGTIAIAPNLQYALMNGGGNLVVMQAPFSAPTFTSVALAGGIASYQTEGIVFDSASRAYVATSGGIAVLDPPYTSVAFTIPGSGESIAITPNGQQLLVTHLFSPGNTVSIYTAPFSATSTPVTLTVTGAVALDGITVTPDGSQAVIADFNNAGQIVVVNAPFNASSTTALIPLGGTVGALEDISVSADGQFILSTGGSGAPAVLIHGPFNASSTVCDVPITGGRGAGAVRFLPVTLQPPIGPPAPTLPVPTLSEWALAALGLLLSFSAFTVLRRRMR